MSYQTLSDALHRLEEDDPDVKAARIRLDDTIDRLVFLGKVQPAIDQAKRQAMLQLLYERYAARDQPGVDAHIICVQLRGYNLTKDEMVEQLRRCDQATYDWWLDPCELH